MQKNFKCIFTDINVNKGDKKMQKMIELNPDANHLLALFAKDTFYQPYRFQKYLRIIISYHEYKIFVKICIRNNLNILHFSLQKYQDALKDSNLLKRLYFLDLSDVIIHELLLSCSFDRPCIDIRHFFDTASDLISIDECGTAFEILDNDYKSKSFDLLEKDKSNFTLINAQLDTRKQRIFEYGMYLRALAFKSKAEEFNIIGG